VVASVMLWGRSARKASTQFPKLLSRDKTLADDPGIDKIPGTECYILYSVSVAHRKVSDWGLHMHVGVSQYYQEFSCWVFNNLFIVRAHEQECGEMEIPGRHIPACWADSNEIAAWMSTLARDSANKVGHL